MAQMRDQLGEVIGQEYGQQFERAVEKHLKVTRNANAVEGVRRALAATTSGDQ